MARLQTMYGDGVLGNHKIIELLSTLIAGVFNYIRDPAKSQPYSLSNIANTAYDYIYPPLPEKEKEKAVNDALMSFLNRAPGFSQKKLKVKKDG